MLLWRCQLKGTPEIGVDLCVESEHNATIYFERDVMQYLKKSFHHARFFDLL